MIFRLFTLLYLTIRLKIHLLILWKEQFKEKVLITLHVTTETRFFYLKQSKNTMVLPKKYDVLTFLLNNIHFLTNLYIQVVGIPMGSKCAPLFVDLLLFCNERNFMMALSKDKQT